MKVSKFSIENLKEGQEVEGLGYGKVANGEIVKSYQVWVRGEGNVTFSHYVLEGYRLIKIYDEDATLVEVHTSTENADLYYKEGSMYSAADFKIVSEGGKKPYGYDLILSEAPEYAIDKVKGYIDANGLQAFHALSDEDFDKLVTEPVATEDQNFLVAEHNGSQIVHGDVDVFDTDLQERGATLKIVKGSKI